MSSSRSQFSWRCLFGIHKWRLTRSAVGVRCVRCGEYESRQSTRYE